MSLYISLFAESLEQVFQDVSQYLPPTLGLHLGLLASLFIHSINHLSTAVSIVFIDSVPVWHQSIFLSPEHDANVGGMILGGVEVGVITCEERGVHERSRLEYTILLVKSISTNLTE